MKLHARWVALCSLGLAAGLGAGFGLGTPLETLVGMMLVTPLAMSIAGTVLGTSQWIVLRRRIPGAFWWIPLSALGLGLGLTMGVVTVEVVGRALTGEQLRLFSATVLQRAAGLAVVGTFAGFSLGALQWIVLRRHAVHAGRWILATTLGLGLGLPGGGLVADLALSGVGTPLGLIVLLLVAGASLGMVTGKGLAAPVKGA